MNQYLRGGPGVNLWFDFFKKYFFIHSFIPGLLKASFRGASWLFPTPTHTVLWWMGRWEEFEIPGWLHGLQRVMGAGWTERPVALWTEIGPWPPAAGAQGLVSCAAHGCAADGQWGVELSPVPSCLALWEQNIFSVLMDKPIPRN